MSISAHCGSCGRRMLLSQLTRPSDGFRCPFCGVAFTPAYAGVTPRLSSRVMATHSALITALAELQSMTDGRLQLDRATVLDPIADAFPDQGLRSSPKPARPLVGSPRRRTVRAASGSSRGVVSKAPDRR